MNTYEILEELKKFTNIYVLPRNKLPRIKKRPAGIVINTDGENEAGEHWVSVYIGEDDIPIYFDSFGLPPLHEDLIEFLTLNTKSVWKYNLLTLQHPESKSCGKYCIEFLKCQMNKRSLGEFQDIFTSDLIRNEKVLNSLKHTNRK